MKTKYDLRVLDGLVENEISVTTFGAELAIYRVAGINPEKGITMKFVKQIGGRERTDWCDLCLNLNYTQNNQAHFDWFIKAISIGHFDLVAYYRHFELGVAGNSTCAL